VKKTGARTREIEKTSREKTGKGKGDEKVCKVRKSVRALRIRRHKRPQIGTGNRIREKRREGGGCF